MRIAQVANFIGPTSGGMKTAIRALGEGYRAAGHETLLVVPGPEDAWHVRDSGVVCQLRAPRVGGGYRLIVEPWRVLEALEDFAPATVEVSDKFSLLPVSRWARRQGVGSVLFSHERLDAMLTLRTGFQTGITTPVAALNRVLVRAVDTIVVTSEFARREFAESAQRAGTPLVKVPLGVDLETFLPRAHVATPVLRLIHVGRLSREKSPHLAVATAVALHRRGVPVRLDVHGEGPHRGELEAMAGGAPVHFHGFTHDRSTLSRAISAADVA
ncbi:MAG: glycosyl transferase, partial [Myxococcales bacterium]